MCASLFFTISTRNATQPLIIPNQQMNLGGKMDKPAGNGKCEAGDEGVEKQTNQVRNGDCPGQDKSH